MRYDFLDKKAYPIGILPSNNDFEFYWMSDDFSYLENIFFSSSLNTVILTLADIFSNHTPNYRILLNLFRCKYIDSYHIVTNKLNRELKDINYIELFLNKKDDNSLKIKKKILIINNNKNISFNPALKLYPFISLSENMIEFNL